MKIEKPSAILATAGWACVFVEGWLLLLRIIPADGLTWVFFGLFFLVAVMASAVYSAKQPKRDGIVSPDDLVVKVDEKVYTRADGNLLIGPERPDGKMVVIVQDVKDKKELLKPLRR